MVTMCIVSQFYIFFTTDYTMADRKRKLETDDSNLENSPKRRKSYSVELKLQIVSELKTSNCSEIARRYKIDRACIREWSKNLVSAYIFLIHQEVIDIFQSFGNKTHFS